MTGKTADTPKVSRQDALLEIIAQWQRGSSTCMPLDLAEKAFDAGRDAGYRDAIRDALQAAENEHLLDATGEPGDIAYDNAVGDCVDAIRKLGAGS